MERKEDEAAALAAQRGRSEVKKPRVFMFGPMGDMASLQTWAPSGNTIVEDLITKAGGRCMTAEQALTGWPQYSLEKLLESDPDIIILLLGEYEFSSVEQFTSMDLVRKLTAVQTGEVYGLDRTLITDLSFANADALLRLARIINEDYQQ
jgi:ABC-type Fe3+-hydroxamate transport system substrate-binding protein